MHYVLKQWRKRATAWSITGTLAVAIALSTSGSAMADGIMLQIKDTPLKDVVMLLTQQSGTNIVIADESKLEKKVTASLNDVPLEKALDYVVKSAGVSYKKMSDGTYIIGGAMLDDDPVLSPKDVALPPVKPVAAERPKEKIITLIKLVHWKPSELLKLTGWNGSNPIANSDAVYPERLGGEYDNNPDNQPNKGGVYHHDRNNGSVYKTSDGVSIQNDRPVLPTIDPTSLNTGAGRTADPYTGAGQYSGAASPPGYQPGGHRPGIPGSPSTPSSSDSSSNNSGNFLWPEGVDDARPFDLDNSIIVKGDEDGIEKFKKIVRMLDVPPKQVQIKAEFVEVKTTDVKRFGIDWSLERLNESFRTAFGPVGNVVFGFRTGNLTAQLKAQLTSDIGRVINAPIISTINNQNAYISINTVIPYWITISTVVGDGTVIDQATPQFITVDTALDVLPRVNGDGTITMILRPRVSDTGNVIDGPDGYSIPEQRNQELFTQRRVANGETIVIGGFIRKNESNSYQKIPILGDLPIVGSLFRSTAKTVEDRELLIFITPTIIPDPVGGTVGDIPIP